MPENGLKLSICIPTFERADFLNYLLLNLSTNIHILEFDYEIVISDNASSDLTEDVVKKYSSKLPIRYFKQIKKLSVIQNYDFVLKQAIGEFSIYVADDDLLDLSVLNSSIFELSLMPDVGAYYAPWKIGNIDDEKPTQFFSIPNGLSFKRGSFSIFLEAILKHHIFPEIGIFRTELLKKLSPVTRPKIAFDFFTIAKEWLSCSDVYITNQCFYFSLVDHPVGKRSQEGIEQVEFMWDSYRGGLEALLGSASQQLAQHQSQIYRQAINQFIAIRMSVAIKIRMFKKRDRIETYLLACRLRGLGFEQLLPLPFNQICVAAALSYILEHAGKLEKFEQLVLLGNFDNSIPDYIKSEFGIANIKIINNLNKSFRNSVVLYGHDFFENDNMHNKKDESNNLYFSERFLLKVKFV